MLFFSSNYFFHSKHLFSQSIVCCCSRQCVGIALSLFFPVSCKTIVFYFIEPFFDVFLNKLCVVIIGLCGSFRKINIFCMENLCDKFSALSIILYIIAILYCEGWCDLKFRKLEHMGLWYQSVILSICVGLR